MRNSELKIPVGCEVFAVDHQQIDGPYAVADRDSIGATYFKHLQDAFGMQITRNELVCNTENGPVRVIEHVLFELTDPVAKDEAFQAAQAKMNPGNFSE